MSPHGARWNEKHLSELPAVALLRRLGYLLRANCF